MDDLDREALACDGATPPRGDVRDLLTLGGGEGPRCDHAGEDAIGFEHVAADEASVAKAAVAVAREPGEESSMPSSSNTRSWRFLSMRVLPTVIIPPPVVGVQG